MTRELLPPHCVRVRDTVEEFWDERIVAECLHKLQGGAPGDFLQELAAYLGASGQIYAMPSAREALRDLLIRVAAPPKNVVLICSFNCPVVMGAVIQAGCSLETFDLSDNHGMIDWELIASRLQPHHLAVVVPHFFGVPTDFRPVIPAAEASGVLLIEDCAQTVGGKIGQLTTGTLGDAALFSFGYDKPLSLGGGGALLINNPRLFQRVPDAASTMTLEQESSATADFISYLVLRRRAIRAPHLVSRFASRLLRKNTSVPPVPSFKGIGPLRAALGSWQVRHYPAIVEKRNANAAMFTQLEGWTSWSVGSGTTPAWLRQKLVPQTAMDTGGIQGRLRRQGYRVGSFNWPQTIEGLLGFPEPANSGFLARCGLDIPVHQNLTSSDLSNMRRILLDGR